MNVDITQFPDIVSNVNDFSFTSKSKTATQGFDIKNDAILECDELFMAEFDIDSLIAAGWNARKGNFPITYIAIDDDDCEYMYACWYMHLNYAHACISVVTMIAVHDISRHTLKILDTIIHGNTSIHQLIHTYIHGITNCEICFIHTTPTTAMVL